MKLTLSQKAAFRKKLYRFYDKHGRTLPWRDAPTPYNVFISEVMLQQTQVPRVIIKFAEFTQAFPDFASLAAAPAREVLAEWQGMGYNRRALYLQRAARLITDQYQTLPDDVAELEQLPGIGPATAAAIATYAFNQPHIFIETNVRAVFIHEFFGDKAGISDKELLPLIEQTIDKLNPRKWYSALMDYGTYIKKTHGNPARRSKHHAVQSKFEGSNRQVRGLMVKELVAGGAVMPAELARKISKPKERVVHNLESMLKEGLVAREGKKYRAA